jgi:hypothetical protein
MKDKGVILRVRPEQQKKDNLIFPIYCSCSNVVCA